MAIAYTTLFARLGKGWYSVDLVNEFSGAAGGIIATDLPTEWEDFVEQYDSANATIRALVADGTQQLDLAQQSLADYKQWVATAIGQTILEMADADNPLTERTLYAAVAELQRQMIVDSKTVNANATSATVTYGAGNEGDGVVVAFMLDDDGYQLQCVYDEDLTGKILDKSTPGSERASVSGEVAASGLLSHRWPLGSGTLAVSLTSIDASESVNLITNGDFETFTVTDEPDDWTIATGAAGSEVFESADAHRGSMALKLIDVAGLTHTITGLESRTPYALCVWLKHDAPAAVGDLTIKLRAIGGSDALDSEAAVEVAELAVSLAPIGTDYEARTLCFTLKESLPAVGVELVLSANVEAANALYVDSLTLVAMDRVYRGGPALAMFSGATNWSLDDVFNVAIANDYGGKVMNMLWRSCDLNTLELRIPFNASAGENILDSVIG